MNPWWYPPNSDVGRRPEPGAAGPGQPARHALDGPLGARRRHPRHAEPGQHRLQPLARLHPHVHPARPSGCSTTSTSARRCSSSDAARRRRSAAVAVVVRAARAARLGPRAHDAAAASPATVDSGKVVAAPDFTRPRVDTDGELSLAALRGKVRRPQLLAVVLPAVHRRGADARGGRRRSWAGQGRRLRRGRRAGPARPGARVHRPVRHHVPDRRRRRPAVGRYGVTGYPETFFIDRERPRRRSPHIVGPASHVSSSTRASDRAMRRA